MNKNLTGALVLLASTLALIGLSGCAAQNTTETASAEPIKTFTPKIAAAKPTPPPMPPGWITDPTSGCKVFGRTQLTETIKWTGGCKKGFANGKGNLQWFVDGKYNSQGDGEWRDGKQTGHGVYTLANGDRYDGECYVPKYSR